jgi:hypothetical protein
MSNRSEFTANIQLTKDAITTQNFNPSMAQPLAIREEKQTETKPVQWGDVSDSSTWALVA